MHDCIKQAMMGDGRLEARAGANVRAQRLFPVGDSGRPVARIDVRETPDAAVRASAPQRRQGASIRL